MEGTRSPQGDSQHGPSGRFSQTRAATCKHQLAPQSDRGGIRDQFRVCGQRAAAERCRQRCGCSGLSLPRFVRGAGRWLGDLGCGEEAAPLNRVWITAWLKPAALGEPGWHELSPFPKSRGGTGALPAHSPAGQGERVAGGG